MRSITHFVVLAFVFLAMTVSLAAPAFCAEPNWILVDENKDSSFFYDKSGTIKPKEGMVRVTTRVVYTEEGKVEALKSLGALPESAMLYESRYIYDIDCVEREGRLLAATHFDKQGVILKSTDLATVTEWEYLPPSTRMALVAGETCGQ